MPIIIRPPAPPRIIMDDDDRARRFRLRLTQVTATLVTLLATAWVCTLGVFPAIAAIMIAKHVFVAILMMGLGVDASKDDPTS